MKVGRVFRSIISGTILLLPIFAAPAFANSITASVPQAGSVLTTSPNSIAISTAAPLSEQGSLIVVNDPNGVAVDDGSITINGNSAEVGLTELITTGSYQSIDLKAFAIERVLENKKRPEPYVL